MYDAVCHTPCPKRSDALLRLLCSAMVDIGFGELAKFLYERYGAGSHTLGKLRRSEMVVPRGPMANAGCEGGTNKRVKKYIGMSMGIGRVIEETVPWIVSEGKNEWNRPGALKMPDVTNSGNTENNNTWKKRRGADSSYAWRDARRLITNYFDDAGKISFVPPEELWEVCGTLASNFYPRRIGYPGSEGISFVPFPRSQD